MFWRRILIVVSDDTMQVYIRYTLLFRAERTYMMYTDRFLHTLQISVERLEEFVSHSGMMYQ